MPKEMAKENGARKQTKPSHRLRINHNKAHNQIQIQIEAQIQIQKQRRTGIGRQLNYNQFLLLRKQKAQHIITKWRWHGAVRLLLGVAGLYRLLSVPSARFHTKDTINDNT